MIVILGLIVLVAALVIGVAGVLGNGGSAHAVSHFSVLGYHLTGSGATLLLSGIVVGAAGLLGLSLLLAGARRTSRRGRAARRGLRQSRRETAAASQQRDDLIEQRETARANASGRLSNGTAPDDGSAGLGVGRWSRFRDLRRRLDLGRTSAQTDPSAGGAAADVPASAPGPDVTTISPASDALATPGPSISPAHDKHVSASAPAE